MGKRDVTSWHSGDRLLSPQEYQHLFARFTRNEANPMPYQTFAGLHHGAFVNGHTLSISYLTMDPLHFLRNIHARHSDPDPTDRIQRLNGFVVRGEK